MPNGGRCRAPAAINLSLTISVFTPLTSGLPSGGPCWPSRGALPRGGPGQCGFGARRSQVPRRCRPLSVTGLAVDRASWRSSRRSRSSRRRRSAQTPTPAATPICCSRRCEGNPNNPPRFTPPGNTATLPPDQAPPAGKFTAPSRIGATPVYGSPTGFGAGDTGFNSSNAPHRRRVAKTPPIGSELAPPPETTFDAVPAPPPQVPSTVRRCRRRRRRRSIRPRPRPGRARSCRRRPTSCRSAIRRRRCIRLTAASRPGAVLPIPPADDFAGSASTPPPGTPPPNTLPLGTVPHRHAADRRRRSLRGARHQGGLVSDLARGRTVGRLQQQSRSTPPAAPAPRLLVVAPELHVRSDWSRNSFTADITGSYTGTATTAFTPSLNGLI